MLTGAFAVAVICALVVFQGGFYSGAVCVIAVVSMAAFVVAAAMGKVAVRLNGTAVFLFAVALCYLASSLFHGATATMLQETVVWFAAAGMSLWCSFGNAREKARTLDLLASAGVVFAVGGIAMFSGILPIEGTVNSGRLMFLFQYANTAGLFFAVVSVLLLHSASLGRRAASAVTIIALLLTQSVGAIAVFVLALVAVGVEMAVRGEVPRKRLAAVGASGAVVLVALAVAFHRRLAQAVQTFIERVVQALDALGALAGNPVVGLGPDQWQFDYPALQSAQYKASQVHCSYLQVAVDAGVLAALIVVAMVCLGLWALAKRKDFTALVCAAMIAVHALFDFDLQFAVMPIVLALLFARPNDSLREPSIRLSAHAEKALAWVLAGIALACSIGGIFLDVRIGQVQDAASRSDVDTALEVAESSLFGDDRLVRTYVVNALMGAAEYREACDYATGSPTTYPALGYQGLLASSKLGDTEAEAELASGILQSYPYDAELFDAVRQLVVDTGADPALVRAFDEQAARANELAAGGRASWLANQETFEMIGGA